MRGTGGRKAKTMVDREKVIYSIERCICHVPDACRDCAYDAGHPYNECVEMMLKDALSLLKAQEPRVMAYDEMMKAEICFLEVKGIEQIDPFIRFEVDDKSYWSSPYTNNEDNPFELLAEQEEYLINARCWTSRPTDEQREKVKWE